MNHLVRSFTKILRLLLNFSGLVTAILGLTPVSSHPDFWWWVLLAWVIVVVLLLSIRCLGRRRLLIPHIRRDNKLALVARVNPSSLRGELLKLYDPTDVDWVICELEKRNEDDRSRMIYGGKDVQ